MARLPIPGGDNGDWGIILNAFLEVAHKGNGTLKSGAITAAGGVLSSQKGAANGIAALNSSKQVPRAQLGRGTASSSNFLRGDGLWAVPSAGSSTLASDSDVQLSTPTNNQVLTFDTSSGKWINQNSSGGVSLDSTASDIQALGTQAAGNSGMAADAKHVHAMPRLDQVSNPTASVSLNSQKITNLANGTVATDAVTFGQLPTSLPPNGTAGGDLGGTYPNPTVEKVNGVTLSGTPVSGNALLATGTNTASWGAVSGTTDWLNVVAQYGADATGTTDATTAIQNALNAASAASGGTVYFPAGTYKISSALSVPNNTNLIGGTLDQGATIIKQTSTTTNGLSATNVTGLNIENLQIYGPSSGSGQGIAFATSGSNINAYVTIRNCTIAHFGSDGVYVSTPIVSVFDRVVSRLNGGHGFNIGGGSPAGGTSCTFLSCYGNANTNAGFYLNGIQYSSFTGCAADNNGTGYYINTCIGLSFNGCGTESNLNNSVTYNGNGFVVYGGSSIGLYSCFVFQNSAIGFWITNAAKSVELSDCTENSPTGTATFSIKYDTSSTGSVLDANVVSATNYVPQINILNDGSGNAIVGGILTIKGSATNTLQLADAASFTHASLLFSAPSAMISFGPGTTLADTTLARNGVNALQSSGSFTAPTIYGATTSGGTLQLYSSSNATKGQILFGASAAYDDVSGSFQFGSTTLNLGGGASVVGIANATTIPTTNPTGGGVLYANAGLPTWRDSAGNVYNLASGGSTVNTPLPDDQALRAWAYDPVTAVNSTAPTVGQLQLIRVILRTQQTISTIYLDVAALANGTLTSGQNLVGLYGSSGVLIDSCADQTTAWGTTGFKISALGSSHALTAGIYYVAFLANVSAGSPTAAPGFARTNGIAGAAAMINAGLTASTARFASSGSSLTALPSSITMSSNSFANVAFWAAID